MPWLNQSNGNIQVQKGTDSRFENSVEFSLAAGELEIFRTALVGVLGTEGVGELRVDYPSSWTIFWKQRDGETRMLLAHPERESWVATVAWSREHVAVLLDALAALVPGAEALRLSALAPVSGTNNLDVLISIPSI